MNTKSPIRYLINFTLTFCFVLMFIPKTFATCTITATGSTHSWTGNMCPGGSNGNGLFYLTGSETLTINHDGALSQIILGPISDSVGPPVGSLLCEYVNGTSYYDDVNGSNVYSQNYEQPYYTYVLFTWRLGYRTNNVFFGVNSRSYEDCYHYFGSPIFISFQPNIEFTSAKEGVKFDLQDYGPNLLQKVAWTTSDSKIGWLIRGQTVTNVKQLFGDGNEQAPPDIIGEPANGYRALKLFDIDKDGEITPNDPIWSELNVWFDKNHNGISEQDEVVSLTAAGVSSINLKHNSVGKKDKFGNEFRFRSKVQLLDGSSVFSYDVFPMIDSTN